MKDEPIDPPVNDAVSPPAEQTLEHGPRDACFVERPGTKEGGDEDQQSLVIPVIYASNGHPVTCTYVNHPAWNESTNICMTLHFIMLTLGPTRTASWSYQFRIAIQNFFDFVIDYNSRHTSSLHIVHIRDITPSILRSFGLFLDETGKARIHAVILKSAINVAANESAVVPRLELPVIKIKPGSGSEPLSEEGVASLTTATRQIVDIIRQTIERRKIIDASEPYTFEELQAHLEQRTTKKDILTWVKYNLDNNITFRAAQAILRLDKCCDPEMIELRNAPGLVKALKKMASADPDIQIPINYEPNMRKTEGWQSTVLEPHRVVKTLNEHGSLLNSVAATLSKNTQEK